MEANTLPKPIANKVATLTKNDWTSMEQADAAADFVRELRFEAAKLGVLTEDEVKMKKIIDDKLADERNAMKLAADVESALKPKFLDFVTKEVTRTNANLPESKQRKFIEGKNWKVQLKDKPVCVAVLNSEAAVKWLKKTEKTAVKTVETVIVGQLTQNKSLFAKLVKLSTKALQDIGLKLDKVVPNGNSTLAIEDFDAL